MTAVTARDVRVSDLRPGDVVQVHYDGTSFWLGEPDVNGIADVVSVYPYKRSDGMSVVDVHFSEEAELDVVGGAWCLPADATVTIEEQAVTT